MITGYNDPLFDFGEADRKPGEPTLAEIRERAAAIRAAWSDAERQKRDRIDASKYFVERAKPAA
jgi:hypothetical protein